MFGTSPPLTGGFSRALRARNTEKVSKISPGASGQGTRKNLQKVSGTIWEVSGESPGSVWRAFLDFLRTFWRLFQGPRLEALGDIFENFFGIEGPRDPCKGRVGPQSKCLVLYSFLGKEHLGTCPADLPQTLGYACTLYTGREIFWGECH